MLTSTFVLLKGVGPSTEQRFWQDGIGNWSEFLKRPAVSGISPARKAWYDRDLTEAISHLEMGRADFFATALKRHDHWRLFETFRHRALYLDIETTGLPHGSGHVTIVGLYRNGRMSSLVHGDSLTEDRLQDELAHTDLLVTFFGSGFDIPYLQATFPRLDFRKPHFDLCPAARRLGLRGGLKCIEREVQIHRDHDLGGLDGWDAVRLWEQWRGGSESALSLLLKYNAADTQNLEPLAHRIYEGLAARYGPRSVSGTRRVRSKEPIGGFVNPPDHWIGAGRTETGRVRPTNQDAFAVLNERMVWLVADGMGGHPAGDVAARMAVASVVQDAERCFHPAHGMSDDPSHLLSEWLIGANQGIYEHARAQPALTGMGTTIVAMAITTASAPVAHIAHLGDSRAYLYRAGTLRQLTRDHTLIEKYLRSGLITEAQSKTHPERHVLTEALGIERHVTPTKTTVRIEPEDRLLLCTDGLTKMLDDRDIAACLSDAEGDPSRICDALIDPALDRGGEDNVTVIVCMSIRSASCRPSNH